MRSFWIWLGLLMAIWTAALFDWGLTELQPYQWFGCALFMGLLFAEPLCKRRPLLLTGLLVAAAAAAASTFWQPDSDGSPSGYLLLLYGYLIGKALLRLPPAHTFAVGVAILFAAWLPALFGQPVYPTPFLLLLAVMLGLAAWAYRTDRDRLTESTKLQEALLSEYRRLKRYGAAGEEIAREQERTRIARDMHDSLGHKLTALSMQLEVMRMSAHDAELERQLAQLKELAQESLAETRKAVGALKHEESGGVIAILELIRRLEAESFVRIGFALGEGVMSAELSSEQAVAVYRAIQEALTNAMRHGTSRQIEVVFEVPGGTMLRFEVSNACNAGEEGFHDGFGLTTMRQRIETLQGKLTVTQSYGRFIVEGVIPLREERHE